MPLIGLTFASIPAPVALPDPQRLRRARSRRQPCTCHANHVGREPVQRSRTPGRAMPLADALSHAPNADATWLGTWLEDGPD